jgi:hypothetical protein
MRLSVTDFLKSRSDRPNVLQLVSNYIGDEGLVQEIQFRKVLPALQTALGISFGGWGLWLRNSVLSRPFWGNSTGWDSTLRFHYWPWPFKFAVVQNIPAFLVGLLLSWSIDSFKPGLPEWVSLLPSLLLVPLLWYLIGAWLDRKRVLGRTCGETVVLIFGVFTAVSLIVAVSSGWIFRSYTTFIPLGIVYWTALAIATYLLGRRWARVAV